MKRKKILAVLMALCMVMSVLSPAIAVDGDQPDDSSSSFSDSGTPADPVTPEDPGTPPADPVTPEDPGTPPADPVTPDDPGTPPADPVTPDDPGTPPADPGTPDDPGETPTDPGTPPADPVTPETPEIPVEVPVVPEVPAETDFTSMTPEDIYAYFMALDNAEDAQAALDTWDEQSAEDLYDVLVQTFTEEQLNALEDHLDTLLTVPEIPVAGAASYTEAGPLMDAVEPEAEQPVLLRGAGRMFFAMKSVVLEGGSPPSYDVSGLELQKSLDPATMTLKLEAWATGNVNIGEDTVKPVDIVLVLDQSGSMATNDFPSSYTQHYGNNGNLYNSRDNLYVLVDGQYYKVTVDRTGPRGDDGAYRIYTYTYNNGSEDITLGVSNGKNTIPPWTFYSPSNITRMAALKSSVNSFLSQVQQSAADNNVDHRVAIVGFAYESNTELLSTASVVNYPATVTDYEDALVSANDSGAVNSRLTTAVDRLSTSGATRADIGMEMANGIFEHNAVIGSERKRVVIMFTDGYPTISSDFSYTVADNAIGNAKLSKNTYGAAVYTVGVFTGADPTADIESNFSYGSANDTQRLVAANRYMHYTSSNHPSATGLQSSTTGWSNNGYYLTAGDTSALDNIFENIAGEIETGSNVSLDGSTIMRDVLSPYVQYDSSRSSDLKAYTVDCTGFDSGGTTPLWSGTQTSAGTPTVTGQHVDISGFNYGDPNNAVVDVEGTPQGKKLVMEIPILAASNTFGGNQVPTNNNELFGTGTLGDYAGIYFDDTLQEPFHQYPTVDIPINYQIDSADQTVYLGGAADLSALKQYATGYTPDGGNNKYVTIVYTLKKGTATVGTYTIYAGSGSGSWNWTSGGTPVLDDCTQYTLSCTVTPTMPGTYTAASCVPTPETPTVHVLKPSLTVDTNDIWADWNTDVDLNAWALGGTGITPPTAYVPTLSDTWTDSDGHTTIPAPTGVKPTISDFTGFIYTFTKEAIGDAVLKTGSTYTTGEQDTDYTVALTGFTLGGTAFTNTAANPIGTITVNYPNSGDHFTLHVNHFDLTVSKTENAPDAYGTQSFQFKLTDEGSLGVPFALGTVGNGIGMSKTFKDLLCGAKTYTVAEDSDWAWRYSTEGSKTVTTPTFSIQKTNPQPTAQSLTFNNTFHNHKWLSDSDGKANIFGANS